MRADANGRLVLVQAMAQLKERLRSAPRQARAVNHILPGWANKPIAREMSIPVPTVRTRLGCFFRKFGGNDRVHRNSIWRPPGATRTVGTTGEDSIVFLDRRRRGRAS